MDSFNKAQLKKIKKGGIKCSCCNNVARKGHGRVDKKVNRIARAILKAETQTLFKNSL
jgi:hypothetical protein